MLPTYTALFEAHRWVCLTRRIRYSERELQDAQIGIARARLLAASLAAERAEDEPAALLLALLLEAEALGDARDVFPVMVVRHFVRASGHMDLQLDLVDRLALRAVRIRAVQHRHEMEHLRVVFDEVRAFVAARLRPHE